MIEHHEIDIYEQELIEEIFDECDAYAENWQRSEEEGWFYPEEDDE